jgi:hypothetical protein
MSPSEHRGERGSLPFALLAVIVVAGLIVVFLARTLTEVRATGSEASYESAIHVAEAGLDAVIAEVNDVSAYVTSDPSAVPHTYTLPEDASEADQRAWAIDIALNGCDLAAVETYRGETCAIRPLENDTVDRDGDGEIVADPLPWIYAVGFVPNAADPVRTRVVKVVFDKGFFSPEKALLTSGELTIGGDLTITGAGGAVHTNASLNVTGCTWSASGTVTYTGTASQTCSGAVASTPSPPVAIPEFSAEMVYRGTDTVQFAQDARASWEYEIGVDPAHEYGEGDVETWYDLCSDGTIRIPNFDSYGEPAPCAADSWNGLSTLLYEASAIDAPAHYRGWTWNAAQADWELGGNPRPIYDGAYYVHHADVAIGGALVSADGPSTEGAPPIEVSVMVDAHGDIDFETVPETDTTCTGGWTGAESGSIKMTGVGAGTLSPFLLDLLFVADRDVQIGGNNTTNFNGFIGVHEQFTVTGTPNLYASLVARDSCDLPSSPVHANVASGNFGIFYGGDINLPLPSVVRITYWSEF